MTRNERRIVGTTKGKERKGSKEVVVTGDGSAAAALFARTQGFSNVEKHKASLSPSSRPFRFTLRSNLLPFLPSSRAFPTPLPYYAAR